MINDRNIDEKLVGSTDAGGEMDLACKERVGDSDSETQSDTEVVDRTRTGPYSPSTDLKYKPKVAKGRWVQSVQHVWCPQCYCLLISMDIYI